MAQAAINQKLILQGVGCDFYERLYKLFGGVYEQTQTSVALPMLESQMAADFLQKGLAEGYTKWFREIREWTNKND